MTQETLAKSHLDNWREATPAPPERMEQPIIWERYGSEWVTVPVTTDEVYSALALYSASRWERRTQSDLPTLAPSAFVFVTTGYGAPLGADGKVEGRPSEHPLRRRLRVMCCYAEDASRVSRLEFTDDGESNETDDGTGQLAEALDSVGWAVWGDSYFEAIMEQIAQATGNPEKSDTMKNLVGRLVNVLKVSQSLDDEDDDESEGE